MLVCDKCGAGIQTDAKFCPQCGDPVAEADKVAPPAEKSAVARVEISFGYSSSPSYKRAIGICENLPSYSLSGEGKGSVHKVVLPITEVELLINLYELVGNWKSSQMLINGHPASKKNLTYHGVGCYRTRQKAYKPDQYCFGEKEHEANIWGCKRLNMPINEWGGGWLDYGDFDKSGVWHFDKRRIQHELEIAAKENELCPVLDRARMVETLDKLPDTINPKFDKNWTYRTNYEDVGGDYKEVAVGIRPILKKVNRYVVGGYKPVWELDSGRSLGSNSDVKIDFIAHEKEQARKASEREKAESKEISGGLVWLIIVVFIVILYFLFW